ncbi:MAG: DUF92 domain-containing protein [Acidobacteriota bacterium]
MSRYSETSRQIVHVAMIGFALLLRYLSWPGAAALAATALAFNWFLLPRVAPGIMRPAGHARSGRTGVVCYPLSVLLLVLVFRDRLDLAAAGWAVMAFGDGAATLAGTRIGGPRLPWNPEKTWSGMGAGAAAGAVGAVGLFLWVGPVMDPAPSMTFIVWASIAAAGAAALAETIPAGLDDNITVPFTAGAVLWLAAAADPSAVARLPALAARLPMGVALNGLMAWSAYLRGSLTLTGAIVGAIIGLVVYLGAGLPGWLLLFAAFVAAVVSSRLGLARKEALGIAEERGGRRGAGNALANLVVGAAGACLMAASGGWWAAPIVFIAGVVAGASDTVASEIGKAFGGTPRLVPSGRPAPPGTPGAVSIAGTLAGLVAALMMALPAADALIGMPDTIPATVAVVVGATLGAFLESALAARFEARGILTNDLLNFINTAAAALAAVLLFQPIARMLE